MFGLFKKRNLAPLVHSSPEETPSKLRRMTLDERQAYRRERLYESIRETFLSMEVVSSMYRFKVMPVDERHHRFIAMIDVAKSFVTGPSSKTKSFAAMEQQMRVNTYKRYGVLIDGIYWRVSETENQFTRHSRANDPARIEVLSPTTEAAPTTIDTPPHKASGRGNFQDVSRDEEAAFMEALRLGAALPPVRVGDMEYQSDMAPLDGGIMIGGTQYGKLQ